MYKIEGLRLNGNEFKKEYIDKNVALFEFDVTRNVSQYLVLYEIKGNSMQQIDLYIGG